MFCPSVCTADFCDAFPPALLNPNQSLGRLAFVDGIAYPRHPKKRPRNCDGREKNEEKEALVRGRYDAS